MNRLVVLLVVLLSGVQASRVTITNNGYENVVVAIGPSVPADQSDLIIDNIKVRKENVF